MITRLLIALFIGSAATAAEPPIAVRVQNFTVQPSTGPVANIIVTNRLDREYTGTLRAQFPTGWKVTPAQHALKLAPHTAGQFPFTIEHGADVAANSYTVAVNVDDLAFTQQVVVASAPYFKPVIDGSLEEWQDAIPIAFDKTILRTYWNKQQFCLAIEVEQDQLPDANTIQLTLAPADETARYDFRITGTHCDRPEVILAAKRTGNVTAYEIAIPTKLLPTMKPTPGREFRLALTIQTPTGTRRLDGGRLVEFGFCSSVH